MQSSNEFVDDLGPCLTKFFANPDFQNEIVKYCINLTDSLMILKVIFWFCSVFVLLFG